ncbi:uncharacterized protein LOC125664222 [Ostrea edulis]|uniref:uncharacterized protein LOC125664222 n=1 Tax=Ostrea edulis TaxID=37623 RepID=UPI0024AFC173|nr:uncharacterized protein LOC125664222 [Ostrea edulis]
MAEAKPSLHRDGTMQVTAKEGIGYLESEGKTKLLEMQGLKDPEPVPNSLKRDGTMAVTAKEAEQLLGKDKPDEDAKTRGQQQKIEDIKEEKPARKGRLAKGVTMIGTAKEAEQLLGADKPDADAMTRGQQKKIEEISKEAPSTPKKVRIQKQGTMAATAKEAKERVLGKEKLGDTRAETKLSKKSKPGALKRFSTINKAIEEAKYVVPEINVNEGRKLRSANKKPAMKRAGTMQTTAAAGKEYLKRSKKAKTSGDSSEED